MRGFNQRDFLSKIKALRFSRADADAPMAFLHYELPAENAVIPFSLSLPVSQLKASLAPFLWRFPPR
ncbi:hypothetical protein A986_04256 [Pseudomonas fluorescens BRIP34879]|nr:hypothetical protein H045_20230 [Pseudomonas poae RE*1-1-14]ELQ18634.1 hypothetical protein A986_04256 [Pseudomonas fluorescens BRIP34879]CRM35900.1 hypothetical protein [Pseudomonas sp. 25 E 4]